MKRISPIIVLFLIVVFNAKAEEIDFISIIKASPETSKSIGIHKLSEEEQKNLNILFIRAYEIGINAGREKSSPLPAEALKELTTKEVPKATVYITKIDEDKEDVLKLANGAIVEITSGFIGFVGFRKDAVLFKDGYTWKIWIKGKKVFKCNLLKAPSVHASGTYQKVYILEVKGNGSILTMLDGSLYEVGSLNIIDTSLWLGNSDALLINGSRLLNLDEAGEIIDVVKIK